MLKKQDLGINPHVTNNDSRDQSLTGQSCEGSHRERVYARSGSGRVSYTAHFYMSALKVYTMRCDLIYNIQKRQDTKVEDYLQ